MGNNENEMNKHTANDFVVNPKEEDKGVGWDANGSPIEE